MTVCLYIRNTELSGNGGTVSWMAVNEMQVKRTY